MDNDDDPAGAYFSPAWCNLLMDELFTAALAGDEKAKKAVRRMLPNDAPSHEASTWRDEQIRELATWLIEMHAQPASNHFLATLIATAGKQLAVRRELPIRCPFDRLAPEELAEFTRRVRWILVRCPRWPGLRRTLDVLSS